MGLLDLTAVELAGQIKSGKTTAVEAMEAVIANMTAKKKSLTVMLHLTGKQHFRQQKKPRKRLRQGNLQDLLQVCRLQ